jgi:hypothetical protein
LRVVANTHRGETHGEKKNVNKQARALYLAKAIFNIRNPILTALGEVREKEYQVEKNLVQNKNDF